jgi:ribose 5-phosphate isomerase RpiB
MDPRNDELVKRIAQEVIRVLKERGVTPPSAPAPASHHNAHIAPPIGQCTGDYSKFPELAGKLYGKAPAPSAIGTPSTSGAVTADESMIAAGHALPAQAPAAIAIPSVVLTGIVTHAMLQAALAPSKDSIVSLAHDARLTPMANDLARQLPGRVIRLAQGAAPVAATKPQDLPWVWWIQGSCPVVRDVTSQRAGRLRAVAAGQVEGQLGKAVREIAGAIRSRQAAGGLMFVPTGAKAVCFANRCSAIRAILGTCGESVEQGIKELGANVLIIEYPHHGYRSVTAMVDRIMQGAPQSLPAVERELTDLTKCS